MVPIVRGSLGILSKSWKVWENQLSTRVQKLTKVQKKVGTILRRLHTTVQKIFSLLRLHIICISTYKFVPLLLFLVRLQVRVNKLVRENPWGKRFIFS